MNMSDAMAHITAHHHDADGWIALCSKGNDSFAQHHYHVSDLERGLAESPDNDLYFSQNTFFKPQRRIDTVRQLRALYVDVDCYKLDLDPHWVVKKLELEAFRQTIPEPNVIVYTGRGLDLVWHIEPVPSKALPLWQAVQRYLFEAIQDLDVGADPNALDAARIFRVAGSVNSKNGQLVHVDFRHDYRYELREIQADYLPEVPPRRHPHQTRESNQGSNQISRMFNLHALNYNRLLDLRTLVELRDGDVEGCRETLCFLYRYWSNCFIGDPTDALTQTLDFNHTFRKPLSDTEVERSTKSAETAWQDRNDDERNEMARQNGYRYAGYNLSNNSLIEKLGISDAEQRHMKTLIGQAEKYRRKNEKRESQRRESGVPT